MHLIALYRETISTLATLSTFNEIRTINENSRQNKNDKNRFRNRNKQLTQIVAETQSSIVFQKPISSTANNNKSISDSKHNISHDTSATLVGAKPKSTDTLQKLYTVADTATITAFKDTQEMSQLDATLHQVGKDAFPETCYGDNSADGFANFDGGNERVAFDPSVNISDYNRCSVRGNHDGQINTTCNSTMNTSGRDRKRKRYVSEEDCTRTTRQKQQLKLNQQQIEQHGRLSYISTVLSKKSRVIADHATNYLNCISPYNSSCTSGSDVHSKKVLRSSLSAAKHDDKKCRKKSRLTERNHMPHVDSGRKQSEPATTDNYQKRAAVAISKKQKIFSSDFSDSNDEDEYDDDGNDVNVNKDTVDEKKADQGSKTEKDGALNKHSYKPVENLIDAIRTKISEQPLSSSLTNASCTSTPAPQASEVEDEEAVHITSSFRDNEFQCDVMNADAKRPLAIKFKYELAWEENLPSSDKTRMSYRHDHNCQQTKSPPSSYLKQKSAGNASEQNSSVVRSAGVSLSQTVYSSGETTLITPTYLGLRGHNYCHDADASVTENNDVATKTKNADEYEGNNTMRHENAFESSIYADQNNTYIAENGSKNNSDLLRGGENRVNDNDVEWRGQKNLYAAQHKNTDNSAKASEMHLETSLASTFTTTSIAPVIAEHSHDHYLVAHTKVTNLQTINNQTFSKNARELDVTARQSHKYTGETVINRDSHTRNMGENGTNRSNFQDKGCSYYTDQHRCCNSTDITMQSSDKCETFCLSEESFSAARTIIEEKSTSKIRRVFTNPTTTTITAVTEGCVSTNITDKSPYSDAITAKPLESTAATTSTVEFSTAKTYENKNNDCEICKRSEPTATKINVNLSGPSSYKLGTSSESLKLATATCSKHCVNENVITNEGPTPCAHTNEAFKRYSIERSCGDSESSNGNVTKLNSSFEPVEKRLCYKVKEESTIKLTVSDKNLKHQQQPGNDHTTKYSLIIEQQQEEEKQRQSKSQTDVNYDTPQSSDDCSTLGATHTYTAEIELQQERERQQRHINQDVQHYMQEPLCDQLQQQENQLLNRQEQPLQLHHEQIRFPQQQQHDASHVLQEVSFQDHHFHSDANSLSYQDTMRRNQHHLLPQHLQLHQRREEQQQQHLIAYLHHTAEQSRLQRTLEHNAGQQQHEYQQQHYERQQPKFQHRHQHQHLHTSLVLTAQQHQQQRQHHMQTALKQLNRPTPTNIDDLIIDEFSEDPHAAYKLSVSPNNVKYENQDDGYETSAGDVLTPNSHSSSTQSVTPQHQMQHSFNGIPPHKCEDQKLKMQQPEHTIRDVFDQQQQSQKKPLSQRVIHDLTNAKNHGQDMPVSDASADLSANPYAFMDENITVGVSNTGNPKDDRASNMEQESQLNGDEQTIRNRDSEVSYMSPSASIISQVDEIFNMHQQVQQQLLVGSNELQESMEYNLKMKLTEGEPHQVLQQHLRQNPDLSQQLPTQQSQFVFNENNVILKLPQKKRGRKKKIQPGPDGTLSLQLIAGNSCAGGASNLSIELASNLTHNHENAVTGHLKVKERKKHDRFNGMSEEEVVKRTLPDHLCDNLDIVIIGINPGLFAAYTGHHYAGPGNHFWKCLYLSGLTQEQMSAEQDYKLLKYGIGFTNMVQRATKGSADLTRKEIKEGSRILLEKLQRYRPKIAVFNGKLIFEVFSGKKDFNFGRQPECVEGTDTYVWVMPSSSARCAQLPRAADKIPFYAALKKFRDYLKGLIPHMDESECIFTEQKIKQVCEQENQKNLVSVASSAAVVLHLPTSSAGIATTHDGISMMYNNLEMRPKENSEGATITTQQHGSGTHSNDGNGLSGPTRGVCGETAGSAGFCGDTNGCSVNHIAMNREREAVLDVNCTMHQDKFFRFQSLPTDSAHTYRSEETARSHSVGGHAPGPDPPRNTVPGVTMLQPNNENCMMTTYNRQLLPGKKKRGRPKKVKNQSLIGPAVRSRMRMMGHMPETNDLGNILNLSIMGGGSTGECVSDPLLRVGIGNGNSDTPKKKRGRPKKLKPTIEARQAQNVLIQVQPDSMSIQALTGIDNISPQRIQQQPHTIYGNKDQAQQHTHQMFTSTSPMRSPALSCSYAGITPPTSTQSTPPTHQQQCDKQLDNGGGIMEGATNLATAYIDNASGNSGTNNVNRFYAAKNISRDISSNSSEHHDSNSVSTSLAASSSNLGSDIPTNPSVPIPISTSHESNLGESPPPRSPHICAVDFEPPGDTAILSSQQDTEIQIQRQSAIQQHSRVQHQQLQQSTRYPTPSEDTAARHQMNAHYQQWLAPHPEMSLPSQHAHDQQEQVLQQTVNFDEHHYQLHHLQQLRHTVNPLHEQAASVMHGQWQRQQQYDDIVGTSYSILSPHPQNQQHPQQHQQFSSQHIHHQNQQQHQHLFDSQHSHLARHPARLASDVSSKSLSGLESLVDQIPTISENNSVSTADAASNYSVSAASESRLQNLQQQHDHQRQQQIIQQQQHHQQSVLHIGASNSDTDIHSDHYCTPNSSNNGVSAAPDTGDIVAGNNSIGSNNPRSGNGLFSANSPGNYSIQRLNSSAASYPVMTSPRHQHNQQQQFITLQAYGHSVGAPLLPHTILQSTPLTNSAGHTNAVTNNSMTDDAPVTRTPPLTNSISTASTSFYSGPPLPNLHNMDNNNFSVRNLAASSVTSSNSLNSNSSFPSLPTTSSATAASNVYHSNFMAAAALAAAAANSSTSTSTAAAVAAHHVVHPQMYIDPHLPPHMAGVNSMYAPAPTHHHHHLAAHHPSHHHHHHTAYGTSAHHSTASDYGNPYCNPTVPGATQATSLHLPSPNYTYGYSSPAAAAAVAAAQSNYPTAVRAHHSQSSETSTALAPPGAVSAATAAAAAAAAAAVYHTHPHHPGHPHTLSMFDRLKPSDISGYGGF